MTGFGAQQAIDAVNNIISGGADVRLLSTEASYTDTQTDIDSKAEATVSLSETDYDVSTASTFTDGLELTNANVIEFGALDGFTAVDAVVHDSGTDNFIRVDVPTDPQLTGEEVTISAGNLTYNLTN